MNRPFPTAALKHFVLLVITLVIATPLSAQDFQFSTQATSYQNRGLSSVQTVDATAMMRRAQQQFESRMRAQGHNVYSTQGIGDFFKPGLDNLIDLIDKVVPLPLKPYIPELPDTDRLGRKPNLNELMTSAQESFMRNSGQVYANLARNSWRDLDNLQAAIERKDGKSAATSLARLAYQNSQLIMQLRAARSIGMRTVTISVSGGGSFFIGADGTHGIAIDIDSVIDPVSKVKAAWYATVAVSGGAQAGASVSLNLGFTPAIYNRVNGLSYEGRLSGTFVAGVGVSIAYDPVNNRFLGGTLSVNSGAEAEASFAMGSTEVIKSFTAPAPPGPTTGNPGTKPITNPELPGRPKSLGIHSTFLPRTAIGSSGERIDNVTPGSAAAQAGLEMGDIIVAANNQRIMGASSLRQAIASSGPVMAMQVINIRNGQVVDITIQF